MTDSITIKELGCLNKNLKTLDERKKYLTNEKYNEKVKSFYNSYTQSGSKLVPYEPIPLKHSIYLEKDGDYLLEVYKENNDKKSLNSKDFDKKLKREYRENNSDLELLQASSTGSTINYTNTTTVVTEDDLKNSNYGNVLNEYDPLRQHLLKEQAKSKTEERSYLPTSKIIKMLGDIHGDQITIKKFKNGIFNFDADTPKSKPYVLNGIDLDLIDYSNPNIVRELLFIVDFNEPIAPSNLSLVQYDLLVMINTLHTSTILKNFDIIIIKMIQEGYNFTEISAKYEISKQAIAKRFNSIVKKICDYNKKKEGKHS